MSSLHQAWSRPEFSLASELVANLGAQPETMIRWVSQAFEAHHTDTARHVHRIGPYSAHLAWLASGDDAWADRVGRAAMLHDVGKLAVPRSILAKDGPLTAPEYEIIKSHTTLGARMLGGHEQPLLRCAAAIAGGHHERWDGRGYPDGAREEGCPIEARLVAIVDVFDALREERAYKLPWPRTRIWAHFQAQRGTSFDPSLVDLFLDHYDDFEEIRASTCAG